MTSRKLVGAALATLASFAVLTGCAGSDTASSGHATSTMSAPAPRQAGHDQADVTFAQGMIPHHEQAITMAKLVDGHTRNAKVVDLAARIQKAQDPEIQQLTGLLRDWGVAPSSEHSAHGSMSGMMTEEELAKLGQAEDAAFDRQWLEMMVKHHEGALEMAKTVLRQGSNAEVKALAQKVIDGQQAEIAEMRALLG
ncbi:DUF305 domain-containing protein [Amycolatopsis regifaucium]|uniref:DUF305 domain-containing protein n=1 Tax=Amycolatopsis regifaucium TaxID=546365 RepID=A0A154MND2_9PSEU|nr:DUF305 domain-containing protein [Amycolatopsis regifaucium]KZB85791.1 DUF305 domain-containing protein [Amycolatopsis regifaucium]OKA10453.1 DUF305 domain-containing protein [Amycolatopsis regifaucium]SFI77779.1 Uncharacterized conserved protein, DUF305 family [Amycolatopsis regifaucium]